MNRHSSWFLHVSSASWLGIDELGDLQLGNAIGPSRALDPARPVGLLPLMERSLPELLGTLEQKEDDLGLARGHLRDLVPWRELPSLAARMPSVYWSDLALGWLESMDPADRDQDALAEMSARGWTTQRIRQRARRLMKHSRPDTDPPFE